ncbi:GcrA family cell cycle regulator [Microvirga tunisiensis]|nr:GcrA family cell cycle regulator [Microvirga tunisiensis]
MAPVNSVDAAAKEECFSWSTEGRIEHLKSLAAEGKKAREIAEIMGTTKNSVICKCNRLGIELKHKKPYMDNLKGIAKKTKNGKPLSEEEVAKRTARLQLRIQNAEQLNNSRPATSDVAQSGIPAELLTFRPRANRRATVPVVNAEVDLSWIQLAYDTGSAEIASVRDLIEVHGLSTEDTAQVLRVAAETVQEICTVNQISVRAPTPFSPAIPVARAPRKKQASEEAAPKAAPTKKERVKEAAQQEELPPYPGSLDVSFMDVKERHCREIMGSDGGLAVFCGQHKKDGSSFCVHHHRMNYVPFTKPKRVAAKKPTLRLLPWASTL